MELGLKRPPEECGFSLRLNGRKDIGHDRRFKRDVTDWIGAQRFGSASDPDEPKNA